MNQKTKIVIIVVVALLLFWGIYFAIQIPLYRHMKEVEDNSKIFFSSLEALQSEYKQTTEKTYCLYYGEGSDYVKYVVDDEQTSEWRSSSEFMPYETETELYETIIAFVDTQQYLLYRTPSQNSIFSTAFENHTNAQFYEVEAVLNENNEKTVIYDHIKFATTDQGAALMIQHEGKWYVLANGEFAHYDWSQEVQH